jgi:DNA primase
MLIKKDDGGYYDRFRDRLMFPIRDRRGRIIGFGGRIIDQGEPKYLNSPETTIFQKGHELYGLYQALQTHRQLNTILVVEGYMDVIALFQHDITYVVATLGTATTANHIERLFRHTTEVTFCFDGDTAGRSAAWRALQTTLPLMHDGVQVRFMFLADGEDPDSLVRKEGKEQFEKLMQTALPIAEFFFQSLAAQTDIATTDGRARFVKLATDLLKNLPAGVFNQMMFDELARRARIDVNQLQPQNTQTASHRLAKPNQTTSARAKPPSTLRLAMMLIVQQPALAHSVEGELPDLDITGYDLFKKVFEQAKTIPDLTTGSLLEQWRDQPEAALLAKLANTEHMIPEAGVPNEFQALIKNLHKLVYEKSIEVLLTKAAMTGLSNDEKVKLSELIRDKP